MEGHLVMSKKERERLVVMARVRGREITTREASEILSISYRQAKRIYRRYSKQGAKGLIHKSRGKRSNRAMQAELRKEILDSYRIRYNGLGATFSAEKLAEEGYKLDHETLRLWLIKEGLWQRRHRRDYHSSSTTPESSCTKGDTFLSRNGIPVHRCSSEEDLS